MGGNQRVEQFAVGMGHALISFRKGIGVKLGNTRSEHESRIKTHLQTKEGHSSQRSG